MFIHINERIQSAGHARKSNCIVSNVLTGMQTPGLHKQKRVNQEKMVSTKIVKNNRRGRRLRQVERCDENDKRFTRVKAETRRRCAISV